MGEPTELVSAFEDGQLRMFSRHHEDLAAAFLAGYRNAKTRGSYRLSLNQWFAFCDRNGFDPLRVRSFHLDLWMRELEMLDRADRTISQRITAVATWYRFCVVQEELDRNPADGVKRPKIDRRTPTSALRRPQLADLLDAAAQRGPDAAGLLMVLGLNGLRIGEACSLDVECLTMREDYPVVTFVRKGGHVGSAVLSRPTENAVRHAIGDRVTGPIFRTTKGTRMNQRAAQRIIDQCLTHVRGTYGRITPHALRHTWTTLSLEAGVPQDQVRHDGGWADDRMVAYYQHHQDNPHKAGTHLLTATVLCT